MIPLSDIISYSLFADADMGIYHHTASQYHAQLKAKHSIVMLGVDKFSYPRKQTRDNEFIPCWKNVCHILECVHIFKRPAILLIIIIKRVTLGHIAAARKVGGCQDRNCDIINDIPFSLCLMWWCEMWDMCLYFTLQSCQPIRNKSRHWAWDKHADTQYRLRACCKTAVTPIH